MLKITPNRINNKGNINNKKAEIILFIDSESSSSMIYHIYSNDLLPLIKTGYLSLT